MYIYISIQIYSKYMNIEEKKKKKAEKYKAVLIENIYKRSQDNRSVRERTHKKKKNPRDEKEKQKGEKKRREKRVKVDLTRVAQPGMKALRGSGSGGV